jgi:hypothetical protein
MKKGKGYLNPDGTGGVGSISFGRNIKANANANVQAGVGKIASNLYKPLTKSGRNQLYYTKTEATKYMAAQRPPSNPFNNPGKLTKSQKAMMERAKSIKYKPTTPYDQNGAGKGNGIVRGIAKLAVATGLIGSGLSIADSANKLEALAKEAKIARTTRQSLLKSRKGQTRGR